ncbi:MAG: response regulator transcription factor [Anaerolineales bacterium]|nr:MAG: response regulator transcription factor [Anaerolineales bacterium]
MTIKFCIADRQPRVRYGMRVLLEQQQGWKVIGEAAEADELLMLVQAGCPDIVLLEWELPGMPAEEIIAQLRGSHPGLRVISLSGQPEARQVALKMGVDGFASKTEPPERLIQLIQKNLPVSRIY